ncbi:hypothetical protein RQP46_000796 [Phenoliferia psychrophenolica]
MSSSAFARSHQVRPTPPPPRHLPRELDVLAHQWLPSSSATLDGELQDTEPSLDLDAPLTPPLTPPTLALQSSRSTPLRTPPGRWTTAPPTPPSESTLRFVRLEPPRQTTSSATGLEQDHTAHAGEISFDRTVGSPPRRAASGPQTKSMPATPTHPPGGAAGGSSSKAPWTWPRRDERESSRLVIDPPTPPKAPVTVVAFDSLVGRQAASTSTSSDLLATRYVRVDGLPRRSNQGDLQALFTNAGLSGCLTSQLRGSGSVVLVFFDIRDALDSIPRLQKTIPFSSLAPLRPSFITRLELQDFNAGGPNPLISLTEGILIINVHGPRLHVSLVSLLADFDVRSIKDLDAYTFIVEFWDDRDAKTAAVRLDQLELQNGSSLACSFDPSYATSKCELNKAPASTPLRPQAIPFFLPPPPAATFFAPRQPVQIHTPLASQNSFRPPSRTPFGSVTNVVAAGQDASWKPVAAKARPRPPPTPQNAWSTPSLTYAKNKAGAGSFRAPEPDWGIYRDDSIPVHNILNLERIEKGLDVRTTLMIKNVPTRMTDVALMAFIDAAVGRCYDFLYLRIDFGSQFNVGYGFVNFTSPAALLAFATARLGTRWNSYHSDKLVVASYGNIQGKENLIEKFKNSAVMLECEDFRPKLFYTDGPNAGKQQPFPKSDDPHRIARSQANVRNVGLYPSSRPIFHVATAISPRI